MTTPAFSFESNKDATNSTVTEEKKNTQKSKNLGHTKKPISPFFLFIEQKREEMKKANPGVKYPELMKMLGKAWGNLTETAKQQFIDLASDRKRKYIEMVNESKKSSTKKKEAKSIDEPNTYQEESKKVVKSSAYQEEAKMIAKLTPPSRPLRPLFQFIIEQKRELRKNNTTWTETEMFDNLALHWRDLPPKFKRPYIQAYKKKYEEYKVKLAKFHEEHSEFKQNNCDSQDADDKGKVIANSDTPSAAQEVCSESNKSEGEEGESEETDRISNDKSESQPSTVESKISKTSPSVSPVVYEPLSNSASKRAPLFGKKVSIVSSGQTSPRSTQDRSSSGGSGTEKQTVEKALTKNESGVMHVDISKKRNKKGNKKQGSQKQTNKGKKNKRAKISEVDTIQP